MVLSLSFGVGALFGEYNTPSYDSPRGALEYLYANARFDKIKDDPAVVYVEADTYRYVYNIRDKSVKRIVSPNVFPLKSLGIEVKPVKRWRMLELDRVSDVFAVASIPTSVGVMGAIAQSGKTRYARYAGFVVTAISIGAIGGVIGYLFYYKDGADYENETFKRILLDSDSWQNLYYVSALCRVSIIWRDLGGRSVDIFQSEAEKVTAQNMDGACAVLQARK